MTVARPDGEGRVSSDPAPLIVTAQLPGDLHRWATDLRAQHFPPDRNVLEAHVTLFHALPAHLLDEVRTLLARLTAEMAPVPARLEGLMNLGRGTALRLVSPAMLALRARIADRFHGMLTGQDSHPPRLHVTIQNKVPPPDAKALQEALSGAIEPRAFAFPGIELHRYRGGPWERDRRFPFRGRA